MIKNVEARNILQGLFDKWNGKSKEVVNEAKVEDVQTTIMQQPTLFSLTFKRKGRNVIYAYYDDVLICKGYLKDQPQIQTDFNDLKLKGYSTTDIQKELSNNYLKRKSVKKSQLPLKLVRVGNHKTKDGRIRINLGFYSNDRRQIIVGTCWPNEEKKFKNNYKKLVKAGKSLDFIKGKLSENYNLKYSANKQSFLKEAPKIPLANYSWNDRGFLLKDGINTKIVPADFNDIESVLANNGSTRSVVSLLPNCDYEALMDLSKYCKTDEYAALRRAGINIVNKK